MENYVLELDQKEIVFLDEYLTQQVAVLDNAIAVYEKIVKDKDCNTRLFWNAELEKAVQNKLNLVELLIKIEELVVKK